MPLHTDGSGVCSHIFDKSSNQLIKHSLCLSPIGAAARDRRQGAPAHQQEPRHPGDPGLARASIDHQHRGLHGAGAEPVQGLLERLISKGGGGRMDKKREDDSTNDFKKAGKAVRKR
jgi:hypothetical protein